MDVAIVGGGLAGLTAAFDLVRAGRGVILFDDQSEIGGQVRTRHDRGFVVEEGAEGFVAADTAVPGLCRDLGIADEIVAQRELRSLLFTGGTLKELSSRDAAIVLGIPVPDVSQPRGLSSLGSGMGRLVTALGKAIQAGHGQIRRSAVTGLSRRKNFWRVGTAHDSFETAQLVVAIPPRAAANLIEPLNTAAAARLREIVLNTNLSVTLAFDRDRITHGLSASGLVVGAGEQGADGLRACVFSSSKFDGRAPRGRALLRAFYRPEPGELEMPDDQWVTRATRTLKPILGISGPPAATWVSRWPEAIPQYDAQHVTSVAQVAEQLALLGPSALAGAAYQPGGVPGAIRSGREAAQRLAGSLPT